MPGQEHAALCGAIILEHQRTADHDIERRIVRKQAAGAVEGARRIKIIDIEEANDLAACGMA